VFVIWDRMFGTFKEEGERCVYGTTKPLASWNPFQAIFSVFFDLLDKLKNAKGFAELWKCFFAGPSWQPAALQANTDIVTAADSRKDDVPRDESGVLVVPLFILGAVLSAFFLWFEGDATLSQRVMGLAFITMTLALSARFMGKRQVEP